MLGEMQELQRLQAEQQKDEELRDSVQLMTGEQIKDIIIIILPSLYHSLSMIELMMPIA